MYGRPPNQLLKAVHSDIRVPELVAGCRALGLINKIITGPLWHVLESDNVTILEMNTYFDVLVTKLDAWAQDASRLLQGDAELYADYPPTKDEIWYCLIARIDHDATTQELLEILCRGGWTRSRELYIFIGKPSFQDNFIKTIVHLKVYEYLNLTVW